MSVYWDIILGKSWEGFVIEKIISGLPLGVNPFFYRTSAGSEIDLDLELGFDNYWAVEIKSSKIPTLKKGFYVACEDLKVKRRFVVYTGEDAFLIGNGTTAISLPLFLEEIKKILLFFWNTYTLGQIFFFKPSLY